MKTKNTESLPMPMIVMTFLVSAQWLVYGRILRDKFIMVNHYSHKNKCIDFFIKPTNILVELETYIYKKKTMNIIYSL